MKNAVIDALAKNNNVVSLAIGGSRSLNKFDEKSDWDIFCLISDAEFVSFKNDFSKLMENIEDFIVFDYSSFQIGWGFLFYGITTKGIQYDIAILPISMATYMGIRSTNIVIKDELGIYNEFMKKKSANTAERWKASLGSKETKKAQFLFNIARYFNGINKDNYLLGHRYICAMKITLCQIYRLIYNLETDVFEIPEKGFSRGDEIYDQIMSIMTISCNVDSLDMVVKKMINIYVNLTNDRYRVKSILNTVSSDGLDFYDF